MGLRDVEHHHATRVPESGGPQRAGLLPDDAVLPGAALLPMGASAVLAAGGPGAPAGRRPGPHPAALAADPRPLRARGPPCWRTDTDRDAPTLRACPHRPVLGHSVDRTAPSRDQPLHGSGHAD